MRFLTAVLALTAVLGCGDGTTELDPAAAAAGTYQLEAFNGAALPGLYFQNSVGRIDVMEGTMVLRADESFTETLDFRITYTDGSATENESIVTNGTFSITGTQITFSVPPSGGEAGFSWTGAVADDAVTYTYEGDAYRYER